MVTLGQTVKLRPVIMISANNCKFKILREQILRELRDLQSKNSGGRRNITDEVDISEKSPDFLVSECLQSLGVAFLTEWDVLVFVYQHTTSLCTAAEIARLIGCDISETGPALQKLESLKLIQRSRASQGIRFYQFLPPLEPSRHSCFLELMNLTQDRAGRVLLMKNLKRYRLEMRRKREVGLRAVGG